MPKYETPDSLTNEAAVAEMIAERHDVKLEKLNPVYRFDYAALRRGVVSSFIEIKCRTFSRCKYDTLMINAHKVIAGHNLNATFDLPALLVVSWTDFTGVVRMDSTRRWNVGMGGRYDRNDPKDIDICVYIPVREFVEL